MKSLVLRLILNAGIVFKYRMSTHGKRQSDISLAMVEPEVPRQSVMSTETGIAGKRNVEVGRHLSFDLGSLFIKYTGCLLSPLSSINTFCVSPSLAP